MAILTIMNELPLYSTIKEALRWAKQRGISGYHVHYWEGQKGYMPGANHSLVTKKQGNITHQVPKRRRVTGRTATSQRTTNTRASKSGGGGGY